MSDSQSNDVLNRLLTILHRSLPMYLDQVDPWTHAGGEPAQRALAQIVADNERDCRRVAELIMDRRGTIELGDFPMEYTDLHFLAIEFLVQELIRHTRLDIEGIENCVARLTNDPAAKSLAEEVLGSQQAHLEILGELARQPAHA